MSDEEQASKRQKLDIVNLLDCPNEIISMILGFVDQEDIFHLRQCCRRLAEIAEPRMPATIFVNYCTFPSDIETKKVFNEDSMYIPKAIQFGSKVKFEYGHSFVSTTKKHFTKVTFDHCENLTDEVLQNLLESFTNVTHLVIHYRGKGRLVKILQYEFFRHAGDYNWGEVLEKLTHFEFTSENGTAVEYPTHFDLMPELKEITYKTVCGLRHKKDNVSYAFESIVDAVKDRAKHLKTLEMGHLEDRFFDKINQISGLRLKKFAFSTYSFNVNADEEAKVMEFLGSQPDIESLEIGSNCSSNLVQFIGENLRKLKYLHIEGAICFPTMRHFENLVSLSIYRINSCRNEHIAENLAGIYPKLDTLVMSYAYKAQSCTDCWNKITHAFPNVWHFSIDCSNLDELSCHYISTNFRLRTLKSSTETPTKWDLTTQTDLKSLDIIQGSIESIPEMFNLYVLNITFECMNENVDDLVKNCPNLRKLKLYTSESGLQQQALTKMCKSFKKLKHLEMGKGLKLKPKAAMEAIHNCKNLRVLLTEDRIVPKVDKAKVMFNKIPSLWYLKAGTFSMNHVESDRI